MEKIYCKFCGTEYTTEAAKCPLCGASNAPRVADDFDFLDDDFEAVAKPAAAAAAVPEQEAAQKEPASEPVSESAAGVMPVFEKAAEPAPEPKAKKRKKGNASAVISIVLCLVLIFGLLAAIFFVAKTTGLLDALLGKPAEEQPDEQPSLELPVEDPDLPCEGISLDLTEVTLTEIGATAKIHASILPEGCTDKVNWISSYPEVAAVDSEGLITAVSEGNVNILVTCGDYAASCMVTVDLSAAAEGEGENAEDLPEEGEEGGEGEEGETEPEEEEEEPEDTTIRLNYTDVTLFNPGEQLQLEVKYLPEGETVVWSADDDVIIELDEDGLVTATGTGTCNVTAQVGEQKFTCIVRCNLGTEPGVKITETLNLTDMTLFYEGEQFRLKVILADGTTGDGDYTWTSSDEEICTVDERGTVTAVSKGQATVSVELEDVVLKCTVRVNIEEEEETEG